MNSNVFPGFRKSGLSGWLLLGACFGALQAQTTSNIQVVATYNRPGTESSCAGIWGWTGSDGREYALVTSRSPGGVMAVEIFDGTNPVVPPKLRGWVPAGHISVWHEVTTAGNYAYKVSQEGSHGIQIIDLAPLNQGQDMKKVKDFVGTGISINHTVFCDTTVKPHRLFVTRGTTAGVRIYSLADPVNPVQIGDIPGEAHDMFARGNRLYVSTQRRHSVQIWNIADPANPVMEGTIELGTGSIAHNAWPTEDNTHLFTTEEVSGKPVKAFSLANIQNPAKVGEYRGPGTGDIIAHNVFVKGNFLYIGYYTAGLRIWDISNPAAMKELAYHRPSTASGLYDGSWGVYPWFKSGLIVHGDDRQGLFVVRATLPSVSAEKAVLKPPFGIRSSRGGALDFSLPNAGGYRLSVSTLAGRILLDRDLRGEAGLQTLTLSEGLGRGRFMVKLQQAAATESRFIALGD
jgi:choice-of-anchor B domain-containing protein